jgi:hypothetical protein
VLTDRRLSSPGLAATLLDLDSGAAALIAAIPVRSAFLIFNTCR